MPSTRQGRRDEGTAAAAALPPGCGSKPNLQASLDTHGPAVVIPAHASPMGETSPGSQQRELEQLKRVFEENMKNKPVRHDQVAVLLLSWEESIDDLKVKEEVGKLHELFKDLYGFAVTHKTLNYQDKPRDQLQFYLAKFKRQYNNEHTLMIIYYAGHGRYEDNGDSHGLYLTASTSQSTPAESKRNNIAWSSAENIISDTEADVLVIFDCCEAGGFGGYHVRSGRPSFEFLAACGKGERTPKPGPNSFTSALMWALKRLREKKYFSSRDLHQELKIYPHLPKTQTPELLRRNEYAEEIVWIAPLAPLNERARSQSPPPGVYRQPQHEYLDIRLDFYRRVNVDDVKSTARAFSKLVNDSRQYPNFARRVVLLDKSSVGAKAVEGFKAGLNRKRSQSHLESPTIQPMTTQAITASPSSFVAEPMQIASSAAAPAPRKRRRTSDSDSPREREEALYHFWKFFECSFSNIGRGIGRIADQVRPSARRPPGGRRDEGR